MEAWTEGDLSTNGKRIHYHRTAGNQKPAILLLHGVTDNGLCWSRVARDLEDTYDVVMTDARGHGRSDRIAGKFSIDLLADDAAGVIRELRLDRPYVFGHSMGAITAVVLAARYPELVRTIVLEDPPLGDDLPPITTGPERYEWHAELKALTREDRLARAFSEHPNWSREEILPWSEAPVEFDPEVWQHMESFRSVEWRAMLERIECPILLIIGDREQGALVTAETAEEAADLWRNGEVAHISGAGHCVHRDRYEETMRVVRAFLKEH